MAQLRSFVNRLVRGYEGFLELLRDRSAGHTDQVRHWKEISEEVSILQSKGRLDADLQRLTRRIVSNVLIQGQAHLETERRGQDIVDACETDIKRILATSPGHKQNPRITMTAQREVGCHSSPQKKRVAAAGSGEANGNDHLRIWFLSHLPHPYPTPTDKDALSNLLDLPRSKIDSDMTNWRRRSGWTDIKDRFCKGSKDSMEELMEGVDRGKEKRQEVLEAVENMRAYLERREEERCGDWVHELTALAERPSKKAKRSISPVEEFPSFEEEGSSPDTYLSEMPSFNSLASAAATSDMMRPARATMRSTSASSEYSSSDWSMWSAVTPFTFTCPVMPEPVIFNPGEKRRMSDDWEEEEQGDLSRPKLESYAPPQEAPQWAIDPALAFQPGHLMSEKMPLIQPMLAPIPLSYIQAQQSIPQVGFGPIDMSSWNFHQSLDPMQHMNMSGNSQFSIPQDWIFNPQFVGC